MQILRGDKVLVSLDPVIGSEQGKTRPCIVVQNNIGNEYSNTTIIVPLTSNVSKIYPTEVLISKIYKAKCDQIKTIDKSRIIKKLDKISLAELILIDNALKVSLNLK